jgi:hypothetical protein
MRNFFKKRLKVLIKNYGDKLLRKKEKRGNDFF